MFSNDGYEEVMLIILFVMLEFCCCFCTRQNGRQFKECPESNKNDIEKVQLLNEIADYYKSNNPILMEDYASKALSLAKK
ncbi:hypothetical protein H9X57_15260 [Flavobacterium piscinae]|uniref:hypothetical protein n=1 Tax=Flavobacterium piscinae TaxID=2506424 RepID=UPI001987C9BF|nr:hypothetical protein [Flavobacterium piscinae]MBC8884230.1 hypothetical protein [Flavobacterium piscinae]